jgi:cupin fold WbuC family metalloprotein
MRQIDVAVLDSLTQKAKEVPRKRAHLNFHPELNDPLQRLCVAIEPGSYIRPQQHAEPATCEIFILLRGSAVLLLFDDSGKVTDRVVLSGNGPVFLAEIPERTLHAIASLESGTIFFEVKQGPYAQPKGEHVAAWAPEEGHAAVARFIEWYSIAKVGDMPPKM